MLSPAALRLLGAALALTLAGCGTTRPLPKFERPLAHTQFQTVRTTAYTHSEADHLPYGHSSALGDDLQSGAIKSAAADWARWPAGTLFRISETGELYQVDDYGWALAGTNTIDLYKPTRAAMNDWGVRRVHIEIERWGDTHRSREVLNERTKYAHVRRMVGEIESDHEPYAVLSAPAQTPPASPAYPSVSEPVPQPELVSVRKPFRP